GRADPADRRSSDSAPPAATGGGVPARQRGADEPRRRSDESRLLAAGRRHRQTLGHGDLSDATRRASRSGFDAAVLYRSLPPGRPAAGDADLRVGRRRGEIGRARVPVVHPDGRVRWILDRARPVFDPVGKLLRMTGAIMDITNRKHAEEALRESEERYRNV